MSKLDASVIIATYNRKDLLAACLSCLDRQDYPSGRFEVIVVDDGSTDGSVEMVERWQSPYRLRCIPADHQGPGPARNRGVAEAGGDIVIFLDSDAFAAPAFISEHLKSHRRFSKRIFVDGPAIYVDGKDAIKQPPIEDLTVRMQAFFDFFGTPFVSVNVSCPRETFLQAGGFDSRFGKAYGWEDTELGVRLIRLGLENVRNRSAYVLHHRDGTPTLESEIRKRAQCGANAALFYDKHPLPEVKKLIFWQMLKQDEYMEKLGLTKWLTGDRAGRWRAEGRFYYPLFRKLFLTHIYAVELKAGLKALGHPGPGTDG